MQNNIRKALQIVLQFFCRYGFSVGVYVVATLFTDAHFLADTADYVDSVEAHRNGINYVFWEFGHLLWRPLMWLASTILMPLSKLFAGPSVRLNIFWTALGLTWISGLACVILLQRIVARLTSEKWIVRIAVAAFIFTHAFLNFSQSGSSYIPGLAFLLLAIDAVSEEKSGLARSKGWLLAGLAFAASVTFWFPYSMAGPGVLLLALLPIGSKEVRWSYAIRFGAVFAIAATVEYLIVMKVKGIHDLHGFKLWIEAAGHGNTSRGVPRMIFGLARSFTDMGSDGILFKRFILQDPFNPVSWWNLLRMSLWKFAFFYLFLASCAVGFVRVRDRWRTILIVVAGMLPIIILAVRFDGGAIERYLPLYPFLFIAVVAVLAQPGASRVVRVVLIAFFVGMTVSNLMYMAKPALAKEQENSIARIKDLIPRLGPESRVFTVTWVEDLVNFNRSFPFHPLNANGGLKINSLVTPGVSQVVNWREDFAGVTIKAWQSGGDVWVSRRVLSSTPAASWDWIEGDDKNVSWNDIHSFFTTIEFGDGVGGDDGFLRVVNSERNVKTLSQLSGRNRLSFLPRAKVLSSRLY